MFVTLGYNVLLWIIAGLLLIISAKCVRLGIRVYREYYRIPDSMPRLYVDLSDVSSEKLTRYYYHSNGTVARSFEQGSYAVPPFDSHGIAMFDYHGEIGRQYNPCIISMCALGNLEKYQESGELKYKEVFLRQADWLVTTQKNRRHVYNYDLKVRKVFAPWISGLTQGIAVSVLLRAWQLTGNEKYRFSADQAFAVLEIPVEQGGVACRTEKGVYFEEFPCTPPASHVMNGHIYALFGIWDMWRVTKDQATLRLFRDGLNALRADLDLYDTGNWVKYDQCVPTSFLLQSWYMNLEIEQLKALYAITNDKIFENYAIKWGKYWHNKMTYFILLGNKTGKWIKRYLRQESRAV